MLSNRPSLLSKQLENFQALSFMTYPAASDGSIIVSGIWLTYTNKQSWFFFLSPRSLHNKKHPTFSHLLRTKNKRKVFYCFIQNGNFSVLDSYLPIFLGKRVQKHKKRRNVSVLLNTWRTKLAMLRWKKWRINYSKASRRKNEARFSLWSTKYLYINYMWIGLSKTGKDDGAASHVSNAMTSP